MVALPARPLRLTTRPLLGDGWGENTEGDHHDQFVPCSLFFKKEMELSLIGLQNAGKTSLVNVIASGAFHEDMIPTVGFNMRKVTRGAVTIKLWDLGGQVEPARALFRPLLLCMGSGCIRSCRLSSSDGPFQDSDCAWQGFQRACKQPAGVVTSLCPYREAQCFLSAMLVEGM